MVFETVEKLDLETFSEEGTDEELENPEEYWRELLSSLRYLGNYAYPRLKEGETWGEWSLEDIKEYFAKAVDQLRSIYIPLIPPEEDDKEYETSYWELYRKSEEYMDSTPPSEKEIDEWNERREDLIKDDPLFNIMVEKELNRNQPRFVLGIIANNNDEVLLIHRKKPPEVWSPPGGFTGTNPYDSVLTEIREEVGIGEDQLARIGKIGDFQDGRIFAFQLKGDATLLEQHEEWDNIKWFPLSNLPQDLSPPLDSKIWSDFFDRRNQILKDDGVHYRESELRKIYDQMPDQVLIVPDWSSITGGEAYAKDRDPNDVDCVFRNPFPNGGAAEKFRRLLLDITGRDPELVPESSGPTWGFLPLFDLVAKKKPKFEIRDLSDAEEEFASRFYKDGLPNALFLKDKLEELIKIIKNPGALKKGEPVSHYKTEGEYYAGEENELFTKFIEPLFEEKIPAIIQPKGDGNRLHIWKLDDDYKVYTEKGLERSKTFPELESALQKLEADNCLLDCEVLEVKGGSPKPRWEMAWMGGADQMPDDTEEVRIVVHDCYYVDGDVIADEPYKNRFESVQDIVPEKVETDLYEILAFPSKKIEVDTEPAEIQAALDWASDNTVVNSEGAMVKSSKFKIEDFEENQDIVKYKVFPEIDCAIIGYRPVPKGRQSGEKWTEEEAQEAWSEQKTDTNTYMFRVALKDKDTGRLLPLRSQQKISKSDLEMRWDENNQKWKGQAGSNTWTMFDGFDQLEEGDFAYNKTYAVEIPGNKPSKGDVITVTPEALIPWVDDDGRQHLSWSHPIAKNIKRDSTPGTIQAGLEAFGLEPSKYDFKIKKDFNDMVVIHKNIARENGHSWQFLLKEIFEEFLVEGQA